MRSISIHAPMRGATFCRWFDIIWISPNFNPRAHEGRDALRLKTIYLVKNFNPRAHEGRDSNGENESLKAIYISIHAPMRGATKAYREADKIREISIHAPMRGATDGTAIRKYIGYYISIHAPMRGATIV